MRRGDTESPSILALLHLLNCWMWCDSHTEWRLLCVWSTCSRRPAVHRCSEAVIARVRIKEAAKTDVFKSANDIADDVLHDILTANNNVHAEAFPNPDALRRAANRACQANRPKDPTTLDFELDHNFYLAIFYVFVKKIVIWCLLTDDGLSVLPRAKTVYMDGTFTNTVALLFQRGHGTHDALCPSVVSLNKITCAESFINVT